MKTYLTEIKLIGGSLVFGWVCCLTLWACSTENKAGAQGSYNLTCTTVTYDGLEGRRCENAETVCYLLDLQGLSCIRK